MSRERKRRDQLGKMISINKSDENIKSHTNGGAIMGSWHKLKECVMLKRDAIVEAKRRIQRALIRRHTATTPE